MKKIDTRGLSCPDPVLKTKEAVEEEYLDAIEVIVDNEAAKENVIRFLKSNNFETSEKQEGDIFQITGKREAGKTPEATSAKTSKPDTKKIMVMVTTDRIGFGDDALGIKLMTNFIKTLKEMGRDLWRIVFINNGVKLTVKGSDVLPDLKELKSNGIHILVCGTCLEHFNLLDKKDVGDTTNMLDIVTSLQLADQVINI